MYNFWPIAITLLALVGIIVIVGRKIPALVELSDTPPTKSPLRAVVMGARRVLGWLPYQPVWGFMLRVWEKILRRLRVFVLKAENTSAGWLSGVKDRSRSLSQRARFLRGEGIALPVKTVEQAGVAAEQIDPERTSIVEALRHNPQDTEAYLALADLHARRAEPAQARAALEKLLAVDPAHSIARQKLEQLLGSEPPKPPEMPV
ncbi:hypothetical protein HYW67_02750 [Candidatus Parcubacteria bacterium]|nr:hypothetical protein [Candidatus Parcubacteria bacterium]